MKHPRFACNPRVSATVHALSGGLNVGTDKTLVGDTELTDCRDMQWKDGALRTRSGFVTDGAHYSALATGHRMQFFTDRDGYLLVLAAVENEAGCDLLVTVFDQDGIPTGAQFMTDGRPGLDGFFVAAGSDERFLRYTSLLFVNNGDIYGVNAQNNVWELLCDGLYEPLYAINGTPAATPGTELTGDRVEPFNMLTEWFRCTYTPDGEGVYYALPPLRDGSDVYVTCGTLSWVYDDTGSGAKAGGYTLRVDHKAGCVWFEKDGAPCALPAASRGSLTVRAKRAYVAVPRVTDMRFGTWYGGDRSAKAGGTRLFLGGGHYVIWSAPNDPLYFPVTAYVSLGDPDEAVTAFGKQGEWLVLFKEHSVYAAEYVRSDEVTADDVQSGAVTDITATAIFPITPIHAEIGCDLPQTVALYGNRLVWACQNGTVYALSAGGALSTRTITVVSAPIRPLLKAAKPTVAAGMAHDGTYALLWDNTLFLLDDDRWTRFTFDATRATAQGLCRTGDRVYIPAAYAVGGSTVLFWFWQAGEADTVIAHTGDFFADAVYAFTKRAVRGMLCTKQFDLGTPDEYKQLTHVFADATAAGDVDVSYLTERGEQSDVPHGVADGVRLTPAVSRCRRFALRLAGANLCVGSITFRVIGGRR